MALLKAEHGLDLKVADAVWVATAMLHRQHPRREGFDVSEIVKAVKAEHLTEKEDISIYLHANQHCVANRPPNQAKLRMLFETAEGQRRLFCAHDRFHSARDGRTVPRATDLPHRMLPLLKWYEGWCAERRGRVREEDPLLAAAGTGKGLWERDAVAYVNRLRAE